MALGSGRFGGLCFALVANPWSLRRPFRPALAFLGNLVVLVGFFALALWRSPGEAIFQQAFVAVHDLLGPAALFWYWMGPDLFRGAQGLAAWAAGHFKVLVPQRALGLAIGTLGVLRSVCGYLLIHRPVPPLFLLDWLVGWRWGQLLLQAYRQVWPSAALYWAIHCHLFFMAGLGLAMLGLALAKRLSLEWLLGLFGLAWLAFFSLLGYFGLSQPGH